MGFPSVCYCVILPQPLILVLQLLDVLRHAVLLCLSSLGLASPPPADDHPVAAYYAPLATAPAAADLWALHHPAASAPSASASLMQQQQAAAEAMAPPPAAVVKALLPAVRYADLLRSRRASAASSVCAVCLGALEPRHRVRELGNCAHAFHKACIDKWVDKGQATCPLCRAALLPHSAGAGADHLDPASSSF